ncbi:MAG: hypothetical protein WD512_14535 [Candidatus Paceibacterota bacterium]
MPSSVNYSFLIVEKSGNIKEVSVKNINKDEIYKKCGFRKPDGFECRTTWENVKVGTQQHTIQLWSRDEGKAGTENKYDFPPPVDTSLYFGNCALVKVSNDNHDVFTSLTNDTWLKIYETLFGGFEDVDDEIDNEPDEPDELDTIKKDMKTKKTGYLKDGFVVDSDEEVAVLSDVDADDDSIEADEDSDENENETETETDVDVALVKNDLIDNDSDDISAGSELEEESYDYSEDE